jgi:hypothetical protein
MFDNNRDIKVGRDINIGLKDNLDSLSKPELLDKRSDCEIILKAEGRVKSKKAIRMFIFGIFLFIALFFLLPVLFRFLSQVQDLKLFKSLFEIEIDLKTQLLFTAVLAFMPVFRPILDLLNPNDIQKKQNELIRLINTIIKEKEYLNKE